MVAIFDPRLTQVLRMIYQKLKALRVPENGRNIRNYILESCAGCVHENTRTDQGGKNLDPLVIDSSLCGARFSLVRFS